MKWAGSEDNLNYDNVNHYYASRFWLYYARDRHFPGFNGKIAYFQFNAGDGSFRKGNDYVHPNDIWGYGAGNDEFLKEKPRPKPQDRDNLVKDLEGKIL